MATPLSYFLSFAFTASGLGKIIPQHPMFKEMVEKAPLWLDALQLSPFLNAEQLRQAIGGAEVFFALVLPFFAPAAYALIIIMCGAIFTHYRLDGDQITPEVGPAAFLLSCLVILVALKQLKKPAPPPESRKED